MDPITRRAFLQRMAACLAAAILPFDSLQTGLVTIPLPALADLEDPLLVRIVDSRHPFSADEIKDQVKPHLHKIPLRMDGILAANENVRVHGLCLPALEELFAASNEARTGLYIHSGFRSYEEQAIAYSQAKDKSVVLKPGASQHHTGLAVDFTSSEIGKVIDLHAGFEATKAGKWISKHAPDYGFVQSYLNGHDGVSDESWHFLYMGRPLAGVYRQLTDAGWYGDVFLLQLAVSLGMPQIVFSPAA